MKRLVSAVALASLAVTASAVDLVVQSPVATGISPGVYFNLPTPISGFSAVGGVIGTLALLGGPGEVTYTFLGKEASNTNTFFGLFDPGATAGQIVTTDLAGTSKTQSNVNGALEFSFKTSTPGSLVVSNGWATNTAPTFAIFDGGTSGYEYILGYSDAGGLNDRDFDDMVIGVNAIPEPQTYALILAGLGVVSFVARRRRQA
jgi:PEP-CTERM motif